MCLSVCSLGGNTGREVQVTGKERSSGKLNNGGDTEQ